MATRPQKKIMTGTGSRLAGSSFDIVECALRNDFKGVDLALQADPSHINAQRAQTGITALMGASGRGLEQMVVHLLSKDGIDTTIADDFRRTAFDHARPFPAVVAALMRHHYPDKKWSEPGIFLVPR